MLTKVNICNVALSRIGVSQQIASLTEGSTESAACALHYDHALEMLLKEVDWGFARRRVTLTAFAGEAPDPWEYQYEFPANCARPLRIDDKRVTRLREEVVPFTTETDASTGARKILTNQDDACLIYTYIETDVSRYPAEFADVLAWRMAAELVVPLSQEQKWQDRAERRAILGLEMAIRNEFRSEVEMPEPEASWIEARD